MAGLPDPENQIVIVGCSSDAPATQLDQGADLVLGGAPDGTNDHRVLAALPDGWSDASRTLDPEHEVAAASVAMLEGVRVLVTTQPASVRRVRDMLAYMLSDDTASDGTVSHGTVSHKTVRGNS